MKLSTLTASTGVFIILSSLIISAHAAVYSIGTRALDASDYNNLDTLDSVNQDIQGPTKINGDLNVTNVTFDNMGAGNLIITGTADGVNISHKGDIIIQKDYKYTNNEASSNGNLLIMGNADCVDLYSSKNVYVYGNLDCTNVNVKGKLKVVGTMNGVDLTKGRLYTFGNTISYTNVTRDLNPESGFFKKVDPFLIFNLDDQTINIIKSKIAKNSNEVASFKKSLESAYKSKKYDIARSYQQKIIAKKLELFSWLNSYIEDTSFDKKNMENIKNYEMKTTYVYLNSFSKLGKIR